MNTRQQQLRELAAKHAGGWIDDAIERQQNKQWLDYSAEIAMRVLDAIDDTPGMTQKKLAEKMGVTPQHISKIVKGNQNLTLETIVKLQEALNIKLLSVESESEVSNTVFQMQTKSHRVVLSSMNEVYDLIVATHTSHLRKTTSIQFSQPLEYSSSEIYHCEN